MSDYSSVCAKLNAQIQALLEQRKAIRKKEMNLKVQEQALSSEPQMNYMATGGASLKKTLSQFLPAHMMPGNVGKLSEVSWPFYYPFDFDFGVNPVLTSLSKVSAYVQVSHEAGFLLMGLYQQFDEYTEAGNLGPYQIEIRDNQSTRQFNDRPIPVQSIGNRSLPTQLPTPLLFTPNASITINCTTWLPAGETMNTIGSGKFQIVLAGIRVRIEDSQDILSTVFAAREF